MKNAYGEFVYEYDNLRKILDENFLFLEIEKIETKILNESFDSSKSENHRGILQTLQSSFCSFCLAQRRFRSFIYFFNKYFPHKKMEIYFDYYRMAETWEGLLDFPEFGDIQEFQLRMKSARDSRIGLLEYLEQNHRDELIEKEGALNPEMANVFSDLPRSAKYDRSH